MTYTVDIEPDCDMGAPWDEHDGHGVVSEWTRRAKRPGEVIIAEDCGSYRYYDVQATQEIALRDGWSAEPHDVGTRRERAARAVQADLERMRAWYNDEWGWVGVVVTDDETGESESLWGIESDLGEYLEEVAEELRQELEARKSVFRSVRAA